MQKAVVENEGIQLLVNIMAESKVDCNVMMHYDALNTPHHSYVELYLQTPSKELSTIGFQNVCKKTLLI